MTSRALAFLVALATPFANGASFSSGTCATAGFSCSLEEIAFPQDAATGLKCSNTGDAFPGKCGSCENGAGHRECTEFNRNRFIDPIGMCGPGMVGSGRDRVGRDRVPFTSSLTRPSNAEDRYGATCSGWKQDAEKNGMFCLEETLADDTSENQCYVQPDLFSYMKAAPSWGQLTTLPRREASSPTLVRCTPTFFTRLPSIQTDNNVYTRWWRRQLDKALDEAQEAVGVNCRGKTQST